MKLLQQNDKSNFNKIPQISQMTKEGGLQLSRSCTATNPYGIRQTQKRMFYLLKLVNFLQQVIYLLNIFVTSMKDPVFGVTKQLSYRNGLSEKQYNFN